MLINYDQKVQEYFDYQTRPAQSEDTVLQGEAIHNQRFQKSLSFPYFNQLLDSIKKIIGPQQFLKFAQTFIKQAENTQKVKEEMRRFEKEVLNIEIKQEEQIANSGITVPQESFEMRNFDYSTLSSDITQEFNDAKWVVLTTPVVQKLSGKQGATQGKESFQSGTYGLSNNVTGANNSSIVLQKPGSTIGNSSAQSQYQNKVIYPPPQKRYGHSACMVKNKMYIFGGLASAQKGGNFQTFYECQIKFQQDDGLLFQWDKIKSDAPRARDSHTCVQIGDSLIMFGGSGGQTSFNDLNKFDIRTQKWSKLEPVGEIPAPREGHTAKLVGRDRMMIHGGVNQSETSFNDTYILTGVQKYIDSNQQSLITQNETKQLTPHQINFESVNNAGSFDTNSTNAGVNSVQKHMNVSFANKKGDLLRWYKCIDKGDIPCGRDSHSSAQINNKIYIFGGQGDNDVIFDDLYSVEIIEEILENGELQFIAQWEKIENQTPIEKFPPTGKPMARTSHTCTVYKNRYLVIIGGETHQINSGSNEMSDQKRNISGKSRQREISIDLDQDNSLSSEQDIDQSMKNQIPQEDGQAMFDQFNNKFLNDVWVYDTVLLSWHEIKAPFKIQGPLAGKKIKKEFEPRMAHSAVQYNQYVIVFGGLNQDRLPISNDLFVLCLDGQLGSIGKALEVSTEHKQLIQIPEVNVLERVPTNNGTNGNKSKVTRTLRITDPEDRKEMSGQILNQIINFNSNSTNQFFMNGNQVYSSVGGQIGFGNQYAQNGNQKYHQKAEIQIQTYDQDNLDGNDDCKQIKKNIAIAISSNDFHVKSQNRAKISFFKSLMKQIDWPIQCFGAFIDNSIQAHELQRAKFEEQRSSTNHSHGFGVGNHGNQIYRLNSAANQVFPNLQIEINLRNMRGTQNYGMLKPSFTRENYIEIKDNGHGIHPKQLMEILCSFGSQNLLQFKSDYNFSEHGLNFKLNSLRLANQVLIISKTKPVVEYGSSQQYLSIGLLSFKFLEEASSQYLVAPLVSYELRNKKIIKNLTPTPEHFLSKIAEYTAPIFHSGEQIQQYALNILSDCGTAIILIDLANQNLSKTEQKIQEIGQFNTDIVLNPQCFPNETSSDRLEGSLRKYLKYLYFEYPENVRITINGQEVELANPYSLIKNNYNHAFQGDKTDKFAVQILQENQLRDEYIQNRMSSDQSGHENFNQSMQSWLNEVKQLQGILIYRGTGRLIRRFENTFGADDYEIVQNQMRKVWIDGNQQVVFKKNGIISVFKSKSTTTIDKKDFTDKLIMKKVRDWFREQDSQVTAEQQSLILLQCPDRMQSASNENHF